MFSLRKVLPGARRWSNIRVPGGARGGGQQVEQFELSGAGGEAKLKSSANCFPAEGRGQAAGWAAWRRQRRPFRGMGASWRRPRLRLSLRSGG